VGEVLIPHQEIFSTVGGGDSNRAVGLYSTVAGGGLNVASGTYSTAIGNRANTRLHGQYSHAAGLFTTTGDAQYVRFVLRNSTTDNTPTLLYLNGTSSRILLQSGYTYSLNFKIMGVKNDGSNIAEFNKKAIVKRLLDGTTSLVSTVVDITPPYEGNVSTDTTVTINDGTDTVDVTVTGITGESWRWVAVVEGIEMKYSV